MPIPFRLDYTIDKTLGNERINRSRVIRRLTGVKLSAAQAQTQWARLLEHKWYLSERLNRDVGLRVAAVDYFENIYQAPVIYKRRDLLPQRLPMMQPLTPVG